MRLRACSGVVVMTRHEDMASAVEAMKMGALDYISKPFSVDEITLRVARIMESLKVKKENKRLKERIGELESRG
jgi:DNA-binding NtrC family response regulator